MVVTERLLNKAVAKQGLPVFHELLNFNRHFSNSYLKFSPICFPEKHHTFLVDMKLIFGLINCNFKSTEIQRGCQN